jgi:amidophosphoribosyltransferase
VFGVWARGEDVAKLTYFGLYALQHRGQESAGIATSDGHKLLVYKDMGLVSQVFDETILNSLTGHIAIGHTRYSTTGSSSWWNAQPALGPTAGGTVALAHNGNLTNTTELKRILADQHPDRVPRAGGLANASGLLRNLAQTNPAQVPRFSADTSILAGLLAGDLDHTLEQTALEILPQVKGAFSLVFMDEERLYAARDRNGVRPLALGKLDSGGWVVASETAALDIVGASFVREVKPGELVVIDSGGLRETPFAEPEPKTCIFEYVYLSRPDTELAGRSVNATRLEMGRALAREHRVEADLVIPVPSSGTPAAIGYAAESGIEFAQGLTKNAYVGRTFIEPSQTIRQLGLRLKLNPLREVIRGQRLVVVDDSIVRGNTQRAVVRMLREAGAKEVHVRISSPPVMWPCFYGIDFATKAELIADGLEVEDIKQSIGADSLGYISLEGMVAATHHAASQLCTACFTGVYPIEVQPESIALGKHLFERLDEPEELARPGQRRHGLSVASPEQPS